jgi:hypothetical protein
MSDISSAWNKVVAYLTGKGSAQDASDAGQKLLTDFQGFVAGLESAGPYAPALVGDTAVLVAEGAALVASKGLTLPAVLDAGSELAKLAKDLSAAEDAFMAGLDAYKAAAAVAAHAPAATQS